MNNIELKKLIDGMPIYISVRSIELSVGMPITTLQKSLKGEILLPKKWQKPLLNYLGMSRIVLADLNEQTNKVQDLTKISPMSNYVINTIKHPLWKDGDPKENSMAFYHKYDCYTYEEIESKLNQ